jgi:RNA polymerase sigma-70 factor (ECF subfamily)
LSTIAFDPNHDHCELDPDTERMIRVAAGDRAAFDELVVPHFPSTVRIISALMGSLGQSEDLAQDVFLRIYQSRERYVPTARFTTWLGTITRNAVLNAKRSLARRRIFATQFSDHRIPTEAGSHTTAAPWAELDLHLRMDEQETSAAVRRAMEELPVRQRKAIELVDFRGMTYLKAAAEMATSPKAIKSLIKRGRSSLQPSLRSEYRRRFDVTV